MREGWERKILKEVTLFKSGKTISKDIERTFGEILYTKVGDMNLIGNEVNITTSSRFVDLKDINEKQIIPIGSIIFPKRGGAIATNKKRKIVKPTIVDLNTMAIAPTKKLLSEYLYYWFESIDLNDLSNGTSIPQINNNSFDNVFMSFPKDIQEQKHIVAILDKAFSTINQAKANIEKNIENAKELFQSKLNAIFSQKGDGWEEKTWNEVLEIRSGRNQKAVENPKGKYPIIGSAGKVMNYADDYLCDEGTTIIGRKGTINNPMYMGTKFWNVDTAFGLHALEGLDKKFLYFFCLSYDFTQRDKGSGRPSLVKNGLLKMKMPLPQIIIQQKTVVKCEKLNEQLNELKKSILQKAFAGELTKNILAV